LEAGYGMNRADCREFVRFSLSLRSDREGLTTVTNRSIVVASVFHGYKSWRRLVSGGCSFYFCHARSPDHVIHE